jgi:tRNA dimethylallyltransferase
VTGPTASGKTELLDRVFGRGAPSFFPSLHTAVISADSMQAYRGMDIGTAKPDASLMSRLPHHLIDIKNPNEQYTAGEFVHLADAACAALAGKGTLPIISGGTGFYIRNFHCGTPFAPPSSPAVRDEVALDLVRLGSTMLRKELESADPISAARISEHDMYRLTRAVEILRASGLPPSRFAPSKEPRVLYEFLILGIERPREELKERIHDRIVSMFEAGLAEEVATLKAAGYSADCPGLKAIGYREFFDMEGAALSEIAAAVELHTTQYAKRQMTFLRALPNIVWIGPDPKALFSAVRGFLHAGLE